MKNNIYKIIVLISIVLLQITSQSQVIINGHIYNNITQLPIANMPVQISADSTTQSGGIFSYFNVVFTDINGYYEDNVTLPSSSMQILFKIGVYDCQNYLHSQTKVSTNSPLVTDFYICPPNNIPGPITNSCHAFYNANTPATQANLVYFSDSSYCTIGNIISYYWDFDDGQHSNNKNPIHTFASIGNYNVCLTIATDSGCTSTYCDTIFAGVNTTPCFAYYTYSLQNSSPYTVSFNAFSNTTSSGTIWTWNFGNNTPSISSQNSNITYTFSQAGTYNVCLTATTSNTCTYSFCDTVTINPNISGYSLCGIITSGTNILNNIYVILYSIDSATSIFTPIDTTALNPNGVYCFQNLPQGLYAVMAYSFIVPSSSNTSSYLPTYYGNVIYWTGAQIIFLTGNSSAFYNFNLTPLNNSSSISGTGNIGGNVVSTLPKALNSGSPYENLLVFLIDALTDEPLLFTYSDENGGYVFNNIAYGTYKVHPELPGLNAVPATIVIDENSPNNFDVLITINGTNITASTSSISKTGINSISDIYPNPTISNSYIKITDNIKIVSVDVFDLLGRKVENILITNLFSENLIKINSEKLNAGVYNIVLKTDNGFIINKKLVKSCN